MFVFDMAIKRSIAEVGLWAKALKSGWLKILIVKPFAESLIVFFPSTDYFWQWLLYVTFVDHLWMNLNKSARYGISNAAS